MQKNKTQLFSLSLFLLFLACFGNIFAQNNLNQPYSRFGFGEVSSFSSHPYMSSLGGLSQTVRKDNILNSENPASFSAINSNSFVFDMGFFGEIARLKTSGLQASTEGVANISHIAFGFPIVRNYKMSFGIMPYSQVDYESVETITTTNLGREKRTHEGSGGINKVYWGHGVKITENLSVGANINLLFGKINKMSSLEFLDSTYFRNSMHKNVISIADVTGSIGAQYQIPIKENHRITLGATYDLPMKFKASVDELRYAYSTSTLFSDDTVINDNAKKDIKLPQAIAAGISYERINKWMVGFDMKYTNWSDYTFLDESTDNRKDNFYAALGGELKGNLSAMNYWNRISWRGGVHFENAKYVIDNNNIDDIGFHLGASFPMRKSRSVFNLSFMYGILGTTSSGLVQKDYMKIGISFSTSDRWFVRRKYD